MENFAIEMVIKNLSYKKFLKIGQFTLVIVS